MGKALRRNLIWAAVALVLLAGGLWWWLGRSRTPVGPTYTTAPAERGKLVARVTATGTLSALVTVQVGAQVSGRIAELHADYNSSVTKGQVLARIDPQLFDAALEQAKANELAAEGNLVKAKAQAADAERQYKRQQELASRKLVAQADLDTAQANADAAKASVQAAQGQLEQTRAQRHQAQVNLAYTTITSPINGTVISRSVDVGQTVAASLQAPTLFTIAEDLRKMQVDTSVAEADVGKLQPGMAATFTVDAFPAERFKGTIRQIRNAPQTVQNVVTYDAVIDVENPELKLRPGMTANVTFIYATLDDALKVPNAALRFKPAFASREGGPAGGARSPGGGAAHAGGSSGGGMRGGGHWRGGADGGAPGSAGQGMPETPDRKVLFVLRGDHPAPVPVRVGITDGSFTEITEGDLKEGDPVITESSGGAGPGGRPGGQQGRFGRVF